MQASHTEKERIEQLCDIILVEDYTLNVERSEAYIREHIKNNYMFTLDESAIIAIVKRKIKNYVKNCKSLAQLFNFKMDSAYIQFCEHFHDYYCQYYYDTNQQNKQTDDNVINKDEYSNRFIYPIEFAWIFEQIQQAIDFYDLYEPTYLRFEEETLRRTKAEATEVSENAQKAAVQASETASKAAESAKKSLDEATDATIQAKNAARAAANKAVRLVIDEGELRHEITKSVNDEVNRIKSTISETSVTILGIFSGIVLAVVTGMFYSSSVLESISSVNFFRLICVASLVGLVCFHLIVVMFRFIERIGKGNEQGCLDVQSKQDDKTEKDNESQNVGENKKDRDSVNQQESAKQKTSKINQYSNCVSVESKKDYFFSDKMVSVVTAILVIVMVLGGVLQFFIPDDVAKRNDTAIQIESNAEEDQTRGALTTEAPEDITYSAENTQ